MKRVPPAKDQRIRFDLADLGMPEVSCIGIYEMTRAERYSDFERHPQELELVFVKRGDFRYPVAGKEYHVRAGEILLIRPGESHGGAGHILERCVHYWMKFRVKKAPASFLFLKTSQARLLLRAVERLPGRQFKAAPGTGELFEEIVERIRSGSGPLQRLAIAARIAAWLTLLVESAQQPSHSQISQEVQAATQLIRNHPSDYFDVDAFSQQHGVSASRFRRTFRKELGLPVHDFQLETRVEEAKRMLIATQSTVTEIAFALGFSSSQYFSTVFKRYTTQTPSEFRQHAEIPSNRVAGA
ncbi:MAG TPA: AraC family transcriptional regulator [Tepidisphaeraceae bacterium]|jgi:AraC-like DNA-binding protein